MSDIRGSSAVEPRCTTGRRKTHVTATRELLYPWHPWANQRVFVHRALRKAVEAAFHCSLDARPTRRLLQIPQWMFDSAVMFGVHLASVPVVDVESLRALKALLSAAFDDDVVQDRHPSVDDTGETDVEIVEAIATGTTEALSSHGQNADLERAPSRSQATSASVAGSTAARGVRSRSGHRCSRRAKR